MVGQEFDLIVYVVEQSTWVEFVPGDLFEGKLVGLVLLLEGDFVGFEVAGAGDDIVFGKLEGLKGNEKSTLTVLLASLLVLDQLPPLAETR